ncbi:MAG: DUF3822 family protein [Flavobacteriaceae bacterium]
MIVQKKTSSTHIQDITSRNLSIQFSLDGFSFCISNQNDDSFFLQEFSFENTVTISECHDKIIEVFKNEKQLQTDFKKIHVIHQNYLNTIVPDDLFDENELASYLKFNIKTLATDVYNFDAIPKINAKNVYVPYTNINNFLFQNFGSFEFKHHTTVLIEKLIAKNNGLYFYVHVSKHHLDIVVLENHSLLFYNSFEYHSKEDFIYYILFTAEQLKMNPNEFTLKLLGNIDRDSELFKIVYTYVRNISFLENKHDLLIKGKDFSNHSNFILLG